MCDHGHVLDGQTVARGRHKRRAAGQNRRLGQQRGRGLQGAQVQARLGRQRGQPMAQIEPSDFGLFYLKN